MILSTFESYAKLAQLRLEKYDDDGVVEKLVRKFSAIMMAIFATIFGVTQLVGNPLECWCPNEYSDSRCDYAKTYCYITNLYVPISNSSHLPNRNDLHSHQILYYQWIPFIFSLQAALFYFPSMVWRFLNSKSGFDINGYIEELRNDNSGQKDSQEIKFVTHHIETCLIFKEKYQHRGFLQKKLSLRFLTNGFYLTFCYLFTKVLYLATIVLQLYVLNNWLIDEHYSSSTNWIFGSHLFKLEERFPHMTLCKYKVFVLTDPQLHWLQCTLPINVYLRKVFLIIYLWIFVLFFLIAGDIFKFTSFLIKGKRFLTSLIHDENIDHQTLSDLSFSLKSDGLVVLNLIKMNTNAFNASAIASNLYAIETKK